MRAGLEPEGEQKPPGITAGVASQEDLLGLGEVIVLAELGAVWPTLDAPVDHTLAGRHGLSRKGCAGGPRRIERHEAVRG